MNLNLKDEAFNEFIDAIKENGETGLSYSLYNGLLTSAFGFYCDMENEIMQSELSENIKKGFRDANLLFYIAQCRLNTNLVLHKDEAINISLKDNSVKFNNTIINNLNPNLGFLEGMTTEFGISLQKNGDDYKFQGIFDENKRLNSK